MSLEMIYQGFDAEAEEITKWFRSEIAGLRTGRVTIKLIETIPIEHYGSRTPLHGLASLSSSDARTLVVAPWDASAIPAIEKALTQAELGVNPVVDGKNIRLSFPLMSEEMRASIKKQLNRKAEESRIRLRQARDGSLSKIKGEQKTGTVTEDAMYAGKKVLDQKIDACNDAISQIVTAKEVEINQI